MNFKISANAAEANCTGHGCTDRGNCLRYLRPAAELGQFWLPYDHDLLARPGFCSAIIEPSPGMLSAMRRAGLH